MKFYARETGTIIGVLLALRGGKPVGFRLEAPFRGVCHPSPKLRDPGIPGGWRHSQKLTFLGVLWGPAWRQAFRNGFWNLYTFDTLTMVEVLGQNPLCSPTDRRRDDHGIPESDPMALFDFGSIQDRLQAIRFKLLTEVALQDSSRVHAVAG